MKLINSSVEIIHQDPGLIGVYKQIEKAARTCYKSEDKITDDSYKKFLKMLYDRGHWACFEQGTVYLNIPASGFGSIRHHDYVINPYSKTAIDGTNYCIVTNFRVLLENNWLDDLKYFCEPTEYHEKRICVKFILSNGIGREFTRHRAFSFMQESTRYVRYDGSKESKDITFIVPSHLDLPDAYYTYWDGDWCISYNANELPNKIAMSAEDNNVVSNWLFALDAVEKYYKILLNQGWSPQQARGVLNLDAKTELVMTGTISQWKEFFKLRCDKAAHPDAQRLANLLKEQFINENLIDPIN